MRNPNGSDELAPPATAAPTDRSLALRVVVERIAIVVEGLKLVEQVTSELG